MFDMDTIVGLQDIHALSVRGAGPQTFVFAHGFGCDQGMWRDVLPHFSGPGERSIAYDLMGHGASDMSRYDRARHGSLKGHAEDLIRLVESMRLERPHFVGHSVAATIGVLAERLRPGLFDSLSLVAPSPRFLNDGDYVGGFEPQAMADMLAMLDSNFLGWSRALAPIIIGNPDRPEFARRLEDSFCRTDPEIARHFAAVTFLSDHREDYAAIRARCLILQCSEDAIAPSAVGEYLERTMRSGVLARLNATGHCPHVTAPSEVVGAIRSFVAPPDGR
jgi:sigma-B regulation protein RsbQ